MRQLTTVMLFILFTFVTVFGLPLLLSHSEHHHDCPLAQGAQLCKSSIVEHMSAWELLLASVLEVLAAIVVILVIVCATPTLRSERARYRYRALARPTLFQELYSSGILNRKEVYA